MKWLPFLATFIFLLVHSFSFSQSSLFIKKGVKKKRIYLEGEMIRIKLKEGNATQGIITLLKDSSIFINDNPIQLFQIKEVSLIKKPLYKLPDTKTMLLIGVGSVLTSIGLSLNNHE